MTQHLDVVAKRQSTASKCGDALVFFGEPQREQKCIDELVGFQMITWGEPHSEQKWSASWLAKEVLGEPQREPKSFDQLHQQGHSHIVVSHCCRTVDRLWA
eukprot:4560397-Amphidinium_carterae.1